MDLIKQIDKNLSFNENTIRIVGTLDNPWFVAKDICDILDIKDNRSALRIIPDKWKSDSVIETTGGKQSMNIVNESGLYKIIMRSNKPIAEKFQNFICEEVLPSLRKQGEYKMQKMFEEKLEEKNLVIYKQQTDIETTTRYLKRINRRKYCSGNSIYIISHPKFVNEYKIGFTTNINRRPNEYETYAPDQYYIEYHRLIKNMKQVEMIIHTAYESKRCNRNKEWFTFEDLQKVIDEIDVTCDAIEKLYKNNESKQEYEVDYEDNDVKEELIKVPQHAIKNPLLLPTKPCNACNFIKPLEEFNLAKEHRDGRENTCTVCRRAKNLESAQEKRLIYGVPDEKTCNKCKQTKPLDKFRKQSTFVDGHRPGCKECDKEESKARQKRPKIEVVEKPCFKCKTIKNVDEFNKNIAKKDGYAIYCKICIKDKTDKYNTENKDKILEKKRQKRKVDKESHTP